MRNEDTLLTFLGRRGGATSLAALQLAAFVLERVGGGWLDDTPSILLTFPSDLLFDLPLKDRVLLAVSFFFLWDRKRLDWFQPRRFQMGNSGMLLLAMVCTHVSSQLLNIKVRN